MPSRATITAAFVVLAIMWIIAAIFLLVDFETLLDQPEDVIVHFQEALSDYDFERAWTKLSARNQSETYGDKDSFILHFYQQNRLRRDIAEAQLQNIDIDTEQRAKALLKNWLFNDFVIVEVVKEQNRGWKIDKITPHLIM